MGEPTTIRVAAVLAAALAFILGVALGVQYRRLQG